MSLELIILGLRRSGTTIFWQTFRQDPALLCYDEPFNPHLRVLPERTGLKAPEEFQRLMRADPASFRDRFAPIPFDQELDPTLTPEQADYLRYLASTGESVAIDTTRCQFKIAALHAIAPEATLVHLYRPAASQVSSHLLPSSPGWRGRLRKRIHRRRFWTRTSGYDHWSFESIIGSDGGSAFAGRMRAAGIDPAAVYALPAVGRLLAFWRVAWEQAEREGRRLYGSRFVSQSFDAFCADPRTVVEGIYRVMGRPLPELDYSDIHPAHGPHQPESPRWLHYGERLGLPRI